MTSTNAGRYKIGDHVVELRNLRLADGASWRRTRLDHEEWLRSAFTEPGVSWESKHTTAAWAEEWWNARDAKDILLSRILTVDDGDGPRVVGQQSVTGPDPRTGQAETLTWVAGLPNSKTVTRWMSAVDVLDAFEQFPQISAMLAVQPVENRGSLALAKSLGFTYLQTLGSLRPYAGEPTDHTIYVLHNTAENRRSLREVIESIAPEPLPASRAPLPPAHAAVDLARIAVRRLRARRTTGAVAPTRALPARTRSDDGLDIAFGAERDGRYPTTVDGESIGELQVTVDGGTSTTTIIDWLRADAPPAVASATIVAACRAIAEHQDTRRLTVALAERHALAHEPLTAIGFVSEGQTLPTLGDEGSPRESWTRIRDDA
ncbi:GNAT family N-acetyltransferase [Tsukamurella ocularis]|uniref:GNAT family N-acetyltransferase n=1 Tax=Tsukamurella ocularis TaxID=1970234 RepID=UPI0039EF7291